MKGIKKLFVLLLVFIAFSYVKAECNDEDLNEWATKAEVKFSEVSGMGYNSSKYAYILSITPPRDDIKIVGYDVNGNTAKAEKYQLSQTEDVYGIGCYTNLEEETYTLKIYGSDNSKCANELLKTIDYTVPRYNRYIKDRRCEDSNSELCQTFTNATKDMDQTEFDKAIKKEINDEETSKISKVLKTIIKYGLYVIIPLLIVSVFYIVKIRKYKKQERDR